MTEDMKLDLQLRVCLLPSPQREVCWAFLEHNYLHQAAHSLGMNESQFKDILVSCRHYFRDLYTKLPLRKLEPYNDAMNHRLPGHFNG